MVLAGHCIVWLPESCIAQDLADGRLVSAGSPDWHTELEIRLYWSTLNRRPAAEQLWTYVRSRPRPAPPGVSDGSAQGTGRRAADS